MRLLDRVAFQYEGLLGLKSFSTKAEKNVELLNVGGE